MKRVNGKLALVAAAATAVAGIAIAVVPSTASAAPQHPAKAGKTKVIVKYKDSTAKATSDEVAASDANGKLAAKGQYQRRTGTGSVVVNVDSVDPAVVDDSVRKFQADPDVEYAEVDQVLKPLAAPVAVNDPEYSKQWDFYEEKAGMNVPAAWKSSTGKDVVVAVIDTGYVKHSDLDSKILPGYDFISDPETARDGDGRDANASDQGDWYDAGECGEEKAGHSSWHGTHVAGTIGAITNNDKGVAGIAYDAKIQPVRVLGKCGGTTSDISDAITWASGGEVKGVPANKTPAKVINMSLGGSGKCSQTTQKAIDGAVKRGTTVVVAAGNSKADAGDFNPANCNNVITVAATDRGGDKAFYSNFGKVVDIAAPGGENRLETDPPGTISTPENGIWSTLNDGEKEPGAEVYKPYMGTSMAAPHIAGLVALVVAKNSKLTPAQIEDLIKNSARKLPGQCEGGCGAGLADAAKTVEGAGSTR